MGKSNQKIRREERGDRKREGVCENEKSGEGGERVA